MNEPESNSRSSPSRIEERLVYVLPESQLVSAGAADGEIDVRQLWQTLWHAKWIIAAVTALFAAGSIIYAMTATEWWRAEVVMAPVEEKAMPAIAGQLGGLAALAGVSLGGTGASADALAILRSRAFAREFISDHDLLPVLFEKEWDPDRKAWRTSKPSKQPDLRDGVKKFHEDVLRVSQDRQTKLVTLAVEWTDPSIAAEWANELVRRANERMRERALRRAEANLAYLQAELAKTNVVTLQESIGRIMESEMQSLMLARGNEDFAFRVLDAPVAPKERVRPRRALIVVLGTLAGAFLSIFGLVVVRLLKSDPVHRSSQGPAELTTPKR